MKKTLFIHIGEPKTATSSIQTFLFKNQGLLKKKGILYPGFITGHHDVANEIIFNTLSQIHGNKKSPAKKFIQKLKKSRYKTYILSAENFCRLYDNVSRLKALIPDDVDVKIICYIRRQDELAEAVYNQRVKSPRGKTWLTIDEFIARHSGIILDHEKVLAPWEEAFGKENIIVRCFEERQLKTDIITDFLDAMGLEADEDFMIPGKRINERFDWTLVELIRQCKIQFKDDIEFHTFLIEYFMEQNIPSTGIKHILSPEKRRKIIESYEDSNRNVAVKYLGREDGRLFYNALPDPDEPYIADLNTNNQNINKIVAGIIYEFYKKNNSCFRKLMRKYKKARGMFSYFEMLKIVYYRFIPY